MSRIVIRNATSYPDDEVRELVHFGFADLDLPSRHSVLARIVYTRVSRRRRNAGERYLYGASGHAAPYVTLKPDVPKGAAYEVVLRIGRPDDFPVAWNDRHAGVPLLGTLRDWREALVAIAAHEGKHIEQYQREPSRRARRQALSGHAEEARCDAYAASRLAAYRTQREEKGATMAARVIVQTDDGKQVWELADVESWQIRGLQCAGNVHGSALAAGIRRAVEDVEAIQAGRDPERLSEKAMRLATQQWEAEQEIS